MCAGTFQGPKVLSPNEDEARAVLLVLMKEEDKGKRFHQGLLSRWCKRSMEHVIGLAIHSIILDIKSIASFVHVIFVFVPMRLNGVTQLLAKLSYSVNRNPLCDGSCWLWYGMSYSYLLFVCGLSLVSSCCLLHNRRPSTV